MHLEQTIPRDVRAGGRLEISGSTLQLARCAAARPSQRSTLHESAQRNGVVDATGRVRRACADAGRLRTQRATPEKQMRGMYSYMADAGWYTDCLTGMRMPVAQEAATAALEAACSKCPARSADAPMARRRRRPRGQFDSHEGVSRITAT